MEKWHGRTQTRKKRENPEFQAILKIAADVLQCKSLDDILSSITRELSGVVDFDRSSVAFLSSTENKLILRNIYKGKTADGSHYGEGSEIAIEATNVIGWVALTRRSVIRNDIEDDDRFDEVVKEERLRSDMVVPLVARNKLVGTLNVGSYRKDAFSANDLKMLENCGKLVCIAIEHMTLLDEARELGERYRLLQENANDIIMLVDKKSGRLVEANKKCELAFGYAREELLKKLYFDLFAEEDVYQARRDFIKILSQKSHTFVDRRMISGDNRIIFVDINANLIKIHEDHFIQVVIHDISQRKMLEKQIIFQNKNLQEINKQLKELDRMKTEFLANISHELRTPLSIIIAYAESMHDEDLLETEKRKFLEVIEENSEHLMDLINNLLDLSKLELSGARLNLSLSHIHDVIRSAWSSLIKNARRKNIDIAFTPGDNIPVIYFDNNQILQVIKGVVSNAIKFTEEDGEVEVSTHFKDNEILISVRDTGTGVPPEEIPHIFTPFHQVDGSSSRKWGGMGIGLALAKHIVELHKGNIWVESKLGGGSTFTFSLPVDSEEVFLASAAMGKEKDS